MPLIEWNTPLQNPMDVLRHVQDAANMLDYVEFCEATGWPKDEYSLAKYRRLQELGRLLSYFDNQVLVACMNRYDRQVAQRVRPSDDDCGPDCTGHGDDTGPMPGDDCPNCHMVNDGRHAVGCPIGARS